MNRHHNIAVAIGAIINFVVIFYIGAFSHAHMPQISEVFTLRNAFDFAAIIAIALLVLRTTGQKKTIEHRDYRIEDLEHEHNTLISDKIEARKKLIFLKKKLADKGIEVKEFEWMEEFEKTSPYDFENE